MKNAKIYSSGDRINWMKIRWLCVSKEDPDTLFVKYDFDQDFLSVPLKGAKQGQQVEKPTQLQQKYKKKHSISAAKKYERPEDTMRPDEHQELYKSLLSSTTINDKLTEPDLEEDDEHTKYVTHWNCIYIPLKH